jgi:23S rRNA (pseudouridine1915-N3)-methyltransferase
VWRRDCSDDVFCRFELTELKAEASLEDDPKVLHVALDPEGESLSSKELARLIEAAGQDVAFYIGGAEEFSPKFKKSADLLLSLSQMTLPHELARVMLLEQLYRAFTILDGHPYAK